MSRLLAPLLVLVLVFVVWQLTVTVFHLPPIVLPSPIAVIETLWQQRKILALGFVMTGGAAFCGLSISIVLGGLIAILFSQSRTLRSALYPYVIFLQTVPIVAIAPLLILWSGSNFRTVVLVSVIISIFPIVSNTTAGLLSIHEHWRDLFRLQNANAWQTLLKLRIPAAIGHLILGSRISCGLAVIGAIVGEFFVGNGGQYEGLGAIMTLWQGRQNTAGLMAALLVSTLLGVIFFMTVNWLSQTLLRRWTLATNLESDA
jgi:NitT/TauT family transport system permease protein